MSCNGELVSCLQYVVVGNERIGLIVDWTMVNSERINKNPSERPLCVR